MSVREFRQHNVPDRSDEGLVDITEAARILAVSVSALSGWIWPRRIAFVKTGRAVKRPLGQSPNPPPILIGVTTN